MGEISKRPDDVHEDTDCCFARTPALTDFSTAAMIRRMNALFVDPLARLEAFEADRLSVIAIRKYLAHDLV